MCFVIPPGVETTYIADEDEPWEYYWIGIHGIEAKDILKQADLTNSKPVVNLVNYERVFSLLESLIICEKRKAESKYFLMGYLYQIIGVLVEENNKEIISKASNNDELVKSFIRYVEEDYASKIKVSYFTEKVKIERTNFTKIFKKHMDITPQNFIINFRLNKSLVLLKNMNLNILEVSSMVGFNDYKHFLKSFKKKYGVTPKAYRRDPFETS
jgi:transcriptional regulator GlxA family with amidase domain